MAPPHFQGSVGGGTSCAQRTSLMLPKKPIETGLSSTLPLAVRHHRLPPELLPTSLKDEKLKGAAWVPGGLQGPPQPQAPLQGPPGPTYLEGPIRPLSIDSSHCPSLYGVSADVYLQCLTTLVLGGNGLSRPGGNSRFRVWGLGFGVSGLRFGVWGFRV